MKNHSRPVDIANRLKISTSTLRGYEERGIVPKTERTSSGYRIYTEEHIAYFECIVAMAPGFGIDATSAVLKYIQQNKVSSALWIINERQVATYQDKELALKILQYLENGEKVSNLPSMSIGEIAQKADVSATAIRYWEKKGYLRSTRGENQYRLFHFEQFIKILLLKLLKNAVYSEEIIQLKDAIRKLEFHSEKEKRKIEAIDEARKMVETCLDHLNRRNQAQLHGLYFLYRLLNRVG
ncbi:MerR family DNA-binding transcriptional regulator [Caldalkalibacillus mannanilyticus]|uniref:MerR family DNA-binding transcriptional regulator n=1 Tax=Caldalkalibacillus mannanilyticus TaxID=1418 RepID=UPI000467EF37|nr:MerR family DNA-binding transcriptional regulator [Caldalkalibacillus mannanilyticus]